VTLEERVNNKLAEEWNNSKLWTNQQCGERARRTYFEPEPVLPTVRMTRGTVFHKVVAEGHKRQMVGLPPGHGPIPIGREELSDMVATSWRQEIERGVTFTDDELHNAEKTLGGALDSTIKMGNLYMTSVAPLLVPVAVERLYILKPANSDITIHGTMDLVTKEHDFSLDPDDSLSYEVIRDQKTSGKAPPASAARDSQQLTFYYMLRGAANAKEGKGPPKKVVLDYVWSTPARGIVNHHALVSTRAPKDVNALVERINASVEAVRKGVFVPANPNDPLCSPKWCPFWKSCKYVTDRKETE
jgi:hypothetical protein